jgi:hypothetical protein
VLRSPYPETSPISRLSRFGFHALKIFSPGQNSFANAAGISDTTNLGLAAGMEEHCLDKPHALHAARNN